MTLISPEYQATNRDLLVAEVGYGSGGAKHVDRVLEYADRLHARSILDYGCGMGKLRLAIRKAGWHGRVKDYDPAIPKKAAPPVAADLVVCTDVLEHVEPPYLGNVLAHLRALARRGLYAAIALRPSNKTLSDGRNAHLIVRGAGWWVQQFRAAGFHVDRMERGSRRVPRAGEPRYRAVILWLR